MLKTPQGRWPYVRYGQGKALWMAFPGFGQSADFVEPLFQGFESRFSCFSFDYPSLPSGYRPQDLEPLNIQTLAGLWDRIRAMEDWESTRLMGYSLGARLALRLYAHRPEEMDQLLLLVPDGWYPRPFYWFCTQQPLGRALFLKALKHPAGVGRMIGAGGRLRIIPPSLERFARHFWEYPEHRKRLGWLWLLFRELQPDTGIIRRIQEEDPKPIHLYLGAKDPLISATKVERVARRIKGTQVKVLDRGHFILDPDSVEEIQKSLEL